MRKCSFDGCNGKYKAKGLCLKHYHRLLRHGDPSYEVVIVGDAAKRLKSHVEIDHNECWNWKRYKKNGYGITTLSGVREQAHRASWKVFSGEVPMGMQVNHKCNNRACINPEHLYAGTQKQNMDDMYRAKRNVHHSGELNGSAKLTHKEVTEIKDMISKGKDNTSISSAFGVSSGCIQFIRIGRTWRHV